MSSQIPHLITSILEKFSHQLLYRNADIESMIVSKTFKMNEESSQPKIQKLIEDLSDFPEYLGECLSIIRCQNLLELFSKDILSLPEAFSASEIVEILSSRKDFDISSISLQLESKFSDSVISCNDLNLLVKWAAFISDFKSKFSVKSDLSYVSLNITLQKLVFDLLNSEKCDVVNMLKRIKRFHVKTGIDVTLVINLTIEKSLKIIRELEISENFWEISEVLNALDDVNAKYQEDLIGRLNKKYGVSGKKVLEKGLKKFNWPIRIKNLSEMLLTHFKEYQDKANLQKVRIYRGRLNCKSRNLVEVIKVENDLRVKNSIVKLKNNQSSHLKFLNFFGYFLNTENGKEMTYICFEVLEKEKSLHWQLKNNCEFNKIALVKSLVDVLAEVERKNIKLYQFSPKKIYIEAGEIKLSMSMMSNIYPESEYFSSFQSKNFTKYLNFELENVNLHNQMIFAFGCTVFYIFFGHLFENERDIDTYFESLLFKDKYNEHIGIFLKGCLENNEKHLNKFERFKEILDKF